MKCPECQHEHPGHWEQMTCQVCDYQFCFDPHEHPPMTDDRWLGLLERASRNGAFRFTFEQLVTAYQYAENRQRQDGFLSQIWLSPFLGLGAGYLLKELFEAPFYPTSFVCALLLVAWGSISKSPSRETEAQTVRDWLEKWKDSRGNPALLLTEPALSSPPPEWSESLIYNDGIEKLLVVNRDLLVDLLVSNGVHTSNRMLIISESGYPFKQLDHVQRYLDQSTEFPIYLLHDADRQLDSESHIESIREKLTALKLSVQAHPIIDLGIHSHQLPTLTPLNKLGMQEADDCIPLDALPIHALTEALPSCLADQISLAEFYARSNLKNADGYTEQKEQSGCGCGPSSCGPNTCVSVCDVPSR